MRCQGVWRSPRNVGQRWSLGLRTGEQCRGEAFLSVGPACLLRSFAYSRPGLKSKQWALAFCFSNCETEALVTEMKEWVPSRLGKEAEGHVGAYRS